MTRALRAVCGVMFGMVACVPAAAAQSNESHWGVSASLVPSWSFPRALAEVWNMETDMRGSELRVGIVRGSDRGGDVGVSFVKKRVADDSTVFLREAACIEAPDGKTACARGPYHITQDAGMTGVEAHIFMPFATIRQRVQIGATFAGGIARIDGSAERFLEHLVVNDGTIAVVTDAMGTGTFKATLQDIPQDWKVVPIGRAELAVAFLVRPGLKLRATGGVNFPGYHTIGFHAHYLFGAD
jgi:hypothetical protein